MSEQLRCCDAQENSNQATCNREHKRFSEELGENVTRLRADCHAQADFAGALGDADQHDVHDADAANQ